MIPVPSGVRVWLAVGHTDMRRYGECLIMRSPGPGVRRVAACRAISLRIIMLLLDAHRIEEDAHAEFDDARQGSGLVS